MESIDLLVLRTARDWLAAGERVLLATVARTWVSSPRPAGSIMALRSEGRVVGGVSGGSIEDDLIQRYTAAALLATARRKWCAMESAPMKRIASACPAAVRLSLSLNSTRRGSLLKTCWQSWTPGNWFAVG